MTKILIGKSNVDLDYPACRPALDLDFTQELLDERITFTRGTTGTRVNEYGYIESVPANQPRFDYDPLTKKCKGLLIENSTSNNLLISDRVDFVWSLTVSGGSGNFIDGETVTWGASSSGIYDSSFSTTSVFNIRNVIGFDYPTGTLTGSSSGATRSISSATNIGGYGEVSANTTTETKAPDGSYNACLITPTTPGSQFRYVNKVHITTTIGDYTFSCFVKNKDISNNEVGVVVTNQDNTNAVFINFSFATKSYTGTLGTGGSWGGNAGFQEYGNGWFRLWVSFTTTPGSHNDLRCSIWPGAYQGTQSYIGSVYAWGMQLENQSFVSSYYPTGISSATRGVDIATMTGTNFSSWYNQLEGTVITDYIVNAPNTAYSNHADFAIVNVDNSNRIVGWSNDSKAALISIIKNNTTVYLPVGNNIGPTTYIPVKKALSLKDKNMNTCVNGTLYTVGELTPDYQQLLANDFITLKLGGEEVFCGPLNGTLARFTYYPKALPPNQLQLLTK